MEADRTRRRTGVWLAICCLALVAADDGPPLRVELAGVHYCCRDCQLAIHAALTEVAGVSSVRFVEGRISFTAPGEPAAQRALAALAAAGFHGRTQHPRLVFPSPPPLPEGRASELHLERIHNCCGACAERIRKAVRSVPGVTSETVAAGDDRFTVRGAFDPRQVFAALFAAGFHAAMQPEKP